MEKPMEETDAPVGSTRFGWKFLLFPRKIAGRWRWLSSVVVLQEVQIIADSAYVRYGLKRARWVTTGFDESATAYSQKFDE